MLAPTRSSAELEKLLRAKIPDCVLRFAQCLGHRCLLYDHDPHIVCAVNPSGVEGNSCLDFRPDPNAEPEETWTPTGYSWYGNKLIPNKPSRYTKQEQLEILETLCRQPSLFHWCLS